jgi:hypothetical protein
MLKHVGRMAGNQRKVIVAYKVVPQEPENCIVVTTENLMAEEHDTLMKLVESPAGQESDDLATAMARTVLPDGRNMLAGFHTTGKMVKVPTNKVEMTPTTKTVILLSELNEVIAQQRGVTVSDLAGVTESSKTESTVTAEEYASEPVAVESSEGVLTDEQLAAQYRSQADALFKEAKALREQAEALVPTKKKTTKKTEESA